MTVKIKLLALFMLTRSIYLIYKQGIQINSIQYCSYLTNALLFTIISTLTNYKSRSVQLYTISCLLCDEESYVLIDWEPDGIKWKFTGILLCWIGWTKGQILQCKMEIEMTKLRQQESEHLSRKRKVLPNIMQIFLSCL